MTVTRVACPDDPRHIESELMCLYAVSKDFRGELRLEESEIEECEQRRCKTLKTRHLLRLEVASHRECDSEEAGVFGGVLQSKDLASAFVDGSGDNRGFHGATFLWRDPQSGVYITGTLSGMTNAGVHRGGCNIIGVYLLRFDANAKGGDGAVQGTFEGVIVCPCG
jgi:hypothetical protein